MVAFLAEDSGGIPQRFKVSSKTNLVSRLELNGMTRDGGGCAEDTSQWHYATLFTLSIGALALSAMLGPVEWIRMMAVPYFYGGAEVPRGSGSTHEAVGFAWGVVGVAAAAHVAAWWRWYKCSSGGGDGGETGFRSTVVRRTVNVGSGSKSRHYPGGSSGPGGGGAEGEGGAGGPAVVRMARTGARAGAGRGGRGLGERQRDGLRQ